MKKVVTPQEMATLEEMAYREGCSNENFMEAAGFGIAKAIAKEYSFFSKKRVLILVGKGNNGGDALVIAKYLKESAFDISVYAPFPESSGSALLRKQLAIFKTSPGRLLDKLPSLDEIQNNYDLIIDGFFGTGFKGSLQEPYLSAVIAANNSHLPIFSIDIPSGLNGETGEVESDAILAKKTFYLGMPKIGFFLRQGWNHVGQLEEIDFGLPQKIASQAKNSFFLIDNDSAENLLPPIVRSRHKYEAGYVVGLAGSKAMPGAAMLSCLAALKSGPGIVRLLIPEGTENSFTTSPYELIKTTYKPNDLEMVLTEINKASACFIGPGLTKDPQIADFLAKLLPRIECPAVIDADALTLIAERKISLPTQCVLTPHVGEMARLLSCKTPHEIDETILQQCQDFSIQRKCTLVLKGGPSWIFHGNEPPIVNATGNPGMATAGAGDVLTGIIAAFLAQDLKLEEAALLGVFLHGLSGDLAEKRKTDYGLIASDIIENLAEAFKILLHQTNE